MNPLVTNPVIWGYMKAQEKEMLQRDIEEVERMLKALIKSLESKRLNA